MRPSLSLAGAMVLSVVVDGAIKHMALDGNQLDTRSLEVTPLAYTPWPCHCCGRKQGSFLLLNQVSIWSLVSR